VIPAAVVRFLQQEGLPAQDVAHQVGRTVEEAWEQQVDTGTPEAMSAKRL
jgi:hypothetical protein